MKLDSWIPLPLLLCFLGCASDRPPPRTRAFAVPEVRAAELSLALSVARSTGRNVLVQYTDEGCRASRRMDDRTFSDPEVKAKLDDVVYVRLQKGESAGDFEERFGERETPTFIVLRPDGTTPGSLVTGEIAASDFIDYLAWARTAEGPEPALTKGTT